ncbi:FusB/FusC family EF-G-binding protein [Falsibacillus pallidus]|uniref:Treble-clef zinc-finger protein n=1 Tax=Falsibacillus pallidus TaxID=493781 RepID=A0A370GPK7_9BACI|nr:FusB/FusC family EF-G-binding protein [Falsibacillus pallidus]RDI45665.1 treble-clef zinc-finger protein [Falsibacillus pallidus]
MEPFIRNDQFNFIRYQTQILINGHSTVNDSSVLDALHSLSTEKVSDLFPEWTESQMQVLKPLGNLKNSDEAESFLESLKPYVIPFKEVTEHTLKKLFPKAKKLKVPPLDSIDFRSLSYLSWIDPGSNKKYMVVQLENKLVGLHGTFSTSSKKGICTICHCHEEVGMFLTETKGKVQGTYTKRGNYICSDQTKCNENIRSLDKLNEFVNLLRKQA